MARFWLGRLRADRCRKVLGNMEGERQVQQGHVRKQALPRRRHAGCVLEAALPGWGSSSGKQQTGASC